MLFVFEMRSGGGGGEKEEEEKSCFSGFCGDILKKKRELERKRKDTRNEERERGQYNRQR